MDEVIRRVGRNRLSVEVASEFVQAGRAPGSSSRPRATAMSPVSQALSFWRGTWYRLDEEEVLASGETEMRPQRFPLVDCIPLQVRKRRCRQPGICLRANGPARGTACHRDPRSGWGTAVSISELRAWQST